MGISLASLGFGPDIGILGPHQERGFGAFLKGFLHIYEKVWGALPLCGGKKKPPVFRGRLKQGTGGPLKGTPPGGVPRGKVCFWRPGGKHLNLPRGEFHTEGPKGLF